jgi:hypothetical protein
MDHKCIQVEPIKRINLAQLQQGKQENMIEAKLKSMVKDFGILKSAIKNIEDKLSTVAEINNELEVQCRVEMGVRAELDKEDDKKNIRWDIILKTIGTAVAVLTFLIGTFLGLRNIEKKLDNLGVPLITDQRGNLLVLPDSSYVKMFPNDSMTFMVKKIKP